MTAVLFTALTIALHAQEDFKILINEGFENGNIPENWIVENEKGESDWLIESTDSYAGTYHISLQNKTGTQQNYKTLLILPEIDISEIFQPILVFAHKQEQWTGDIDTLRILYRTSNAQPWTTMAVFANATEGWRMDTVPLNSPSNSYQIAFKGEDNLGKGVKIDNVIVRSTPRCEQPSNINVNNLTQTSCTLNWYAGFEAVNIAVKISTKPLTIEELENEENSKDLFLDTLLSGTDIQLPLNNLSPAVNYYVFIKSICIQEESDWSDAFMFSTSNVKTLPYYEDFNLPYQSGYNAQIDGWYYGTSTDGLSPFINTSTSADQLCRYSEDCSTSLCFCNNGYTTSAIPTGEWSYAATPQIQVEKIQDVQVSFDAKYRINDGSIKSERIILGVMSDPNNLTSFVPVDTFSCVNMCQPYSFSTMLNKYQGSGKYITFLSNFAEKNIFFLDNLRVDYAGECKAPDNVRIKVTGATVLDIEWNNNGEPKSDIAISQKKISPSEDITSDDNIVKLIEDIPANSRYEVTGLEAWEEYYVYIRNTNDTAKSPWCAPTYIHMPEKVTGDELSIDFEVNPNDSSTFYCPAKYMESSKKLSLGISTLGDFKTSDNAVAEVTNTNYISSSSTILKPLSQYELKLTASTDQWSAAVFPEIENIREWRAQFWSCQHYATDNHCYMVGIMSDASDINTFYPLDTIIPKYKHKLYTIEFDKYPADSNGRFFCILLRQAMNTATGTSAYIDNLLLEKIPECREPYNVDVQTTATTATLNWEKLADSYNIRIHTDTLSEAQLDDDDFNFIFKADAVTDLPIEIKDLTAGQEEYHYYIQPVCGSKKGEWTTGESFKTQCYSQEKLPYYVSFDGIDHNDGKDVAFPIPCVYSSERSYSSKYWPYLDNSTAYNGSTSLYMGSATNGFESYIAFPDIEAESIQDVELTFVMCPEKETYELIVGIMEDPTDIATFTAIDTVISNDIDNFNEYIVPFNNYTGSGRHIALYCPNEQYQRISVDSVVISLIGCSKASALATSVISDTGAGLTWQDGNPSSWDLIVSTKELSTTQLDTIKTGMPDIIFADNISTKPYHIDGLTSDTKYYFYVRGICGNDTAPWPFKAGEFTTVCDALELGEQSIQNFDSYGTGNKTSPNCWTVGNPTLPASPASYQLQYIPQCSDAYAHSGNASLQFYSTTSYNGAYAISPLLAIDDIRKTDVSFWATCTEEEYTPDNPAQLIIGVVSAPNSLSSFVPLDTIYAHDEEQLFRIRLDNYKTDDPKNGGRYVMFLSETNASNYVYIDDVRFDTTPQCPMPVSLRLTNGSMNSAEISWRGGVPPYKVVYAKTQLSYEELESGMGTDAGTTTDTITEISGLETLTEYYVYVKSNCEKNQWSAPLRFETECADIRDLPFKDNFDANPFIGYNPLCWHTYYSKPYEETAYPTVEDDAALEGKSLYFYVNKDTITSYAVTPKLNVEDIRDCYVSFYAKGNNTSLITWNVVVGIVSDVSSYEGIKNTFCPIDTIMIHGKTYFEKHIVSLANVEYQGEGKHIAFTTWYGCNKNEDGNPSAGGVYLDEVEIGSFYPCPFPTLVYATEISDTKIAGKFNELGEATSWQAVCVETRTDISNGSPIQLNSKEFEFTELKARTSYDIYIRSSCDESETGYSEWSEAFTVRTTNVPFRDFPFETGFEPKDENNAAWDSYGETPNSWHIGCDTAKSDTGSMYISCDGGKSARYDIEQTSCAWIYRTFDLTAGEYAITFDWQCVGEREYDFIRAGFLETSIQLQNGNPMIMMDASRACIMGSDNSGTPVQWISLEGIDDDFDPIYELSQESNWVHDSVRLMITEEMAGLYNLVFMWKNDNSTGSRPEPSAVIDNLKITRTCTRPVNLNIVESNADSTVISWETLDNGISNYEVFVTGNPDLYSPDYAEEDDERSRLTTTETKCTLKGLKEWSVSYIFIRSLCSDTEYSGWSDKISFRSDCATKSSGDTLSFEEALSYAPETSSYQWPDCFTVGHEKNLDMPSSYYPYVQKSTSSYCYSHSGNNALFLQSSSETNIGGYITIPAYDPEAMQDAVLSFYFRPFYHMVSTGKISSSNYVDVNSYTRTLTIGTMSDPNDPSTFKKIEDVTYPYTSDEITSQTTINDDPNKDNWWIEYRLALDGKYEPGDHIAIMTTSHNGLYKSYMYIDDITIGPAMECGAPYNVTVSDVRSTSAKITFTSDNANETDRFVLHLSSTPDMSDTIQLDTISTSIGYELDNLNEMSSYSVRIKRLCQGEESGWSIVSNFNTAMSLPFYEQFEEENIAPTHWKRSNKPSEEEIFDNSAKFQYVGDNITGGWARNDAFASQCAGFSTTCDYWLFTPAIDLGEKTGLKLTFKLALTAQDSPLAPVTLGDEDKRFLVIISDDAGKTWKRENATIWNNIGTGDYVFDKIPNTPQLVEIDMQEYDGKVVMIAFYMGSDKTSMKADLHIDDVRINNLEKAILTDDICETNSYNKYGFSRHYDELSLGVHEMTRFALAADESKPDTIYDLTLSVNSLNRTYLTDSVCQGDVYDEYGFSTDMGGIQKQKFAFGDGRCDSVVYLDLKVIPVPTSVTTVTICQGQTYPWNGRELERSGEYTDTLQATSCDCDSIATLLLTVTDAEVTQIEETVCHDGSFDFGGRTLTESGVYRDTVTDESGCMAITELTLTVLPDYRRSYTAYFCAGTSYSDENFQGVTEEGTYTNPLTSTVGGCDSTVTITLIALGGDTVRVTDSITTGELPYTVDGTDITYEAGTEPGTYTDTVEITVSTEAGECSDVLIHTLVIDDVTAFNSAEVKELILTPNPVRVHESVMVHLELTPEEREGLTVQVFSSTGSLMRQFTPDGEPITIDGLDAAGVYMVRIVDGLGKVYTGKVIVR